MQGMTGAIRQEALSKADFGAAERHGKRLDTMSQARRVRDRPPLVYGSLDLEEARAAHMNGVQQQGKTAALHMLVQFPTVIRLNDQKTADEREQMMLDHAVNFANRYHGGDAVFAARLDRDEQGRHTVDVFAMPRYDFTYKDGRTVKRAAVSKFAKEQARKRHAELVEPGENLRDPESPIVQGRALQAAWHEYMRDEMGLYWVQAPNRKKSRTKDRLEPEEYSLSKRKSDAEAEAIMIVSQAREEARKEADQIRSKAKEQVVLALKEVASRDAVVAAREKAVLRDALTISAARESIGRPDTAVEEIVQRRQSRRRDLER